MTTTATSQAPASTDAAPADPAMRPRRRVAVGPARPQYLHDAETDRLMMIVTALASEVSAHRDRLDTHEALAAQGVWPTAAAVEAFVPDAAREAAREAARLAMLRRVYRVVTEELDALREGTPRTPPAAGAQAGWTPPDE